MPSGIRIALLLSLAVTANAQNFSYTINTVAGQNDLNDGGLPSASFLRQPQAVIMDGSGNLYIADSLDNRVRLVSTAGVITTYAGNGNPDYSGDGARAASAGLNYPDGLALDSAGNLYISDSGNNVIRKVTAGGIISTYAGTGSSMFGGDGGQASLASLSTTAIALDAAGDLYIADSVNYRIRKIDTKGVITTIAGTGTFGFSGDGGVATSATLGYVTGVASDTSGNIYIADDSNGRIRRIDATGVITSIAGDGSSSPGIVSGNPTSVGLIPIGLATDAAGFVYFTDSLNDIVGKLDVKNNVISTLAGSGVSGFAGDGGVPLLAQFDLPWGLSSDSSGQHIFVADSLNGRIREVTASTVSTVAGAGPHDGGPALSGFLSQPQGVAIDSAGNLYIADTANFRIREVTPSGTITTIANLGIIFGAPVGVAVDGAGNVYTSTNQFRVLKIAPQGDPLVFAGNGREGFSGDGSAATNAELDHPEGLAVDAAGNVYIADWYNERVRKVTTDGIIQTVVGSGNYLLSGDGGPGLQAGIDPYAVALDSAGDLFVADYLNSVVRKIDTGGVITTVAGNGQLGFSGDRGPATDASLGTPVGVGLDATGALFIADQYDGTVWRVGSTGFIAAIAGSGTYTPTNGENIPAVVANIDAEGLAVDLTGNVYLADQLNDRVRKLTPLAITVQSVAALSGDAQSAGINNALAQPLQVQVKGSDGLAYFGVPVTFQVTSGTATLGAASVVTDANGIASNTLTLGATTGAVTVTATVAGLAPITFTLTALDVPAINAGGITGAGLSVPAVSAVSPGGIFTIFGTLLAVPGTSRSAGSADLVNGALPTNLAGTCVEVGGVRAPLFFVSPLQINAEIPNVAAGAAVSVDVITGCDSGSDARGAAGTVTVQSATPEFFYSARAAQGAETAAIAALNAVSGAIIGPSGSVAGAAPAQVGDLVSLFGTGLGAVTPVLTPGVLATGAFPVASTVTVQLGGVTLSAADLLYAGTAPGFAGLYQINIRVPVGTPNGPQALIVTVDGISSPSSGFLEVGN